MNINHELAALFKLVSTLLHMQTTSEARIFPLISDRDADRAVTRQDRLAGAKTALQEVEQILERDRSSEMLRAIQRVLQRHLETLATASSEESDLASLLADDDVLN